MNTTWQDVLDRFSYGIYLIATRSEEGTNGMIASWVTQCSHDPPLVMVAIRKNRLTHSQIMQYGTFCIQVLPRDALHLIGRFKIPEWKRRFEGIEHIHSSKGIPVLSDAIGYLECVTEKTIDSGDHSAFLARVVGGSLVKDGEPLTTGDYQGKYRGDR